MNTLIIYASKTGTTQKCAIKIKEELVEADLINIKDQNKVDLNSYDCIVIGSPIRIGMIDKNVKEFIIRNIEQLKNKKVGIFLCCGFNENKEQYFKENIPTELLEKVFIYDTFGGEMELDKQKGFDKFIVKMVTKANPDKKVGVLEDHITAFIDTLRNNDKRID